MPKVVDAPSQREAIREAARRVFAQRGVRGTGLAHVAAAVGMGRSSLYHYYPDKGALLADMVHDMLDRERQLFRSCLAAGGSPIERLEGLARACAAWFPEWADFGRLIIDLRLEDAKGLRKFFRAIRRDTAAVIAEGQADSSIVASPDSAVLASILIGAIDGLLLQYFIEPRALPTPDDLAQALVDVTHRMLSA
jgi:AcrR family transcriptional regulator